MSNNNKYLKSGGLNPHWVEEQCYRKQLERDLEYERLSQQQSYEIAALNNPPSKPVSDQTFEELFPEVVKFNEYLNNNFNVACESTSTLEEQFEFLKSHSDNQEDLELAKFIIANQK